MALQLLELSPLTNEQRREQELGHRQCTNQDIKLLTHYAMVAQRLASRTVAYQSGVRDRLSHYLFRDNDLREDGIATYPPQSLTR